ncbi:hypothetical protein [Sediminibacillus massiliensis]|uniref:hypothetical protein n=1 Tax=Sediminibacillus massiliensis TaxID=1926277 RepID=UPI0009886930|nr:hypothetical protein [Sediminibacillus massiliensis]
MSESKLLKGIIIGATVGGLISLADKSTRVEVSRNLKKAGDRTNYYLKNPSDVIQGVRSCYEQLASNLFTGADSVVEMLSDIQQTIEKVSSTDEHRE